MSENNLEGRKALVTGSSRGIGRAIALELARRGVDVVINYLRRDAAAEDTAREIRRLGRETLIFKANVGSPVEIGRLVEATEAFSGGRVDFLIHNAALAAFKPLLETRKNQFDLSIDVNTWAVVELSRRLIPLMKDRSGRVIVLSSRGAQRALPGYAAAGASKAAVETLIRYLAVELAPFGIRANVLSAGPVETDSFEALPGKEEVLKLARKAPLGRIGKPEDIARCIAMLCSSDADWITGQVIHADGGFGLL